MVAESLLIVVYASRASSADGVELPALFVRSHHFKPMPGSITEVTAIAFVFNDKAELTDVVLEDGLTVRGTPGFDVVGPSATHSWWLTAFVADDFTRGDRPDSRCTRSGGRHHTA